jgi:hypothetical protein
MVDTSQPGPEYQLTDGEWTEIIGERDAREALNPSGDNDRFDVVVKSGSVYLSHSANPTVARARGPYDVGTSGPLDVRGEPLRARAVSGTATVSADEVGFFWDNNAVNVDASVSVGGFESGAIVDGPKYPETFDPPGDVYVIEAPIIETEVELEITTTAGDTFTLPIDSAASITSYRIDTFTVKNPANAGARVVVGWAGE